MTVTADPSLVDRIVIVTGGGRGLGREMALALVEAGARVVITGTDRAALDRTVADGEAVSAPGRMVAAVADVRVFAECQRVVATTHAAFGRPAVLINNAGRGMRLISEAFTHEPTRFWETDPAAWAEIVDVNVNGAFNMARAAVPPMVEAGFGKVIGISTSAQTMVRRGYAPYGPSKAALEAASRIWAQDLAGTGVDVNVYLPGGASDTDLLPDRPDKRGADGNLLPPAIMRPGILWLAGDLSNGHTGGRYIARLWDTTLPPADAARAAHDPDAAAPPVGVP